MFDHLDDPTPPPAGPEVRDGVRRRVRRHHQRRQATRAAALVVALVGGMLGVLVATGDDDGPSSVEVADAPNRGARCCGTVTGTVTADDRPLADVRVVLLHRNGAPTAVTFTDDDGAYRFEGVPDATYLVQMIDDRYERRTEWWDDATVPSDARPLRVRPDELVVADAELEPAPGQGITGTVGVPGGWPIADVTVWLFHDGELVRGTRTDEDGRFELPALEPGVYQLLLWDDERDRFPAEWYLDGRSRADASSVLITEGRGAEVIAQVDP